jgi:hypothetical protein
MKRDPVSFKVTNWVWALSESRNGSRLVMLALADRADDNGCAWPSIDDLAERTKLTPRAVQKAIAALVDSGELEVENGGGRHRSNRYRIVPKPRTLDGVTDEKPRTLDGDSVPETPNSAQQTPNFETETPNFGPRNPVQSSPEPSVEPPQNQKKNQPPPSPTDQLLDEWWDSYGRRTAQSKRTIRRAIDDALTNGIDPTELKAALVRLGELSKPVTGGTLQFALAETRRPTQGAFLVALDGQGHSTPRRPTTDQRVADAFALADRLEAEERNSS